MTASKMASNLVYAPSGHSSADGGRPGQRPRHCGVERRRPWVASRRDADARRPSRRDRDNRDAHLEAVQRQFFLPRTADIRCRPRGTMASPARAVLSRELGIDPQAIQPGPGRAPFDHVTADVLAQFKPPVVSFHFGLPSKDLLDRVRQGDRRSSRRQQPSTRRAGSRRRASTRSSRKASKPVVIAECFCRML